MSGVWVVILIFLVIGAYEVQKVIAENFKRGYDSGYRFARRELTTQLYKLVHERDPHPTNDKNYDDLCKEVFTDIQRLVNK